MKTTLSFTNIAVVALSRGFGDSMPEHIRRIWQGASKGSPVDPDWIQGEKCDYSQTARTSKRAACWRGFRCRIQRTTVLHVSGCDQGPHPRWQSNPVQRLQTGACRIRTNDEPQLCGGNPLAPSDSHSTIRWFRSAWRLNTFETWLSVLIFLLSCATLLRKL